MRTTVLSLSLIQAFGLTLPVIVYMYCCVSMYMFTQSHILYSIIRGEPERAPNTRETGSGVYIYIFIYLFIYLFVRDLAWQRLSEHAQTPRGRPYRVR